ncbi:MAG: Ig-like domain-containing protein [Candidatus Eisenbacteria bacterium]
MSARGSRTLCRLAVAVALIGGGCAKHESAMLPTAPGPVHVLAVWPTPRSTGVLEQAQVWAAFDTTLDPATVDDRHVFLKLDTQRVPIRVTWDGTTHRVLIQPLVPMTHSRTHTVELAPTIRTADGGTLDGGYTWQFRVTGAGDPVPKWPIPGATNESPVVMLEWQGTEPAAGTLRYELYAGSDSAAVAARAVPALAVLGSSDRATPTAWPLGSTTYWAVTAINQSTGDTRVGAVASFTTLPPGTPTTTQRIPLLDWGYAGSGGLHVCNSALFCRADLLTTLRWNIRARYAGLRLARVRLELGADDTLGDVRVWGTRSQWNPCTMAVTGPPTLEPAWGSGAALVVGTRRLRYDSVLLASVTEAIARGRAVDGYVITSNQQRTIATAGTNSSTLDITSYVLPVSGVTAPSSGRAPPAMVTHANPVRRR